MERMNVAMNVRDDSDSHRASLSQRRLARVRDGGNLARVIAGLALAAAWAAAAAILLRTKVPPGLELPRVDARDEFPAAALVRIDDFRTGTRALWAASLAVELGVLVVLVRKASPLAALVSRVGRGRVRTAVGLGLVAVAAVWVTALPLGAAGHWWRRRYGLSEQGYGGWLRDAAVSLGVRGVLVAAALAGAVALAVRLGRRWWLAAAPALVVVGVVYILAEPLVVQPLFNRFQPLPDRRLVADVERLADRMGVAIETVQVADASRRTTTANAYVAGIGPTRRVVFYDTILDGRFSERELVWVAAHELAHVERRHLWKGLAWFALFALPGVAVVALATERRGGLANPELVPLALLVVSLVSLATQPAANAISRRYEAEADWLALAATRDAAAAAALERRFVLTSLSDPDPPAWARVLLSTHPPAVERVAMARAFESRAAAGSTMAP